MRYVLLKWLRCPVCRGPLEARALEESSEGEIVQGALICACGLSYPVVDTIPRMLMDEKARLSMVAQHGRQEPVSTGRRVSSEGPRNRFERLLARTQASFGYQWTTFSEMACDFHENFWNYLHPATPEYFRGRIGLDAGCGFGRHIYHAASCGAEMVGVDCSRAIDATRQNTKHLRNVHLVQADIYHLPFAEGVFDFVYSIGVLHHLPDPARGLQSLVPLLKSDGTLFVWLYSSKRQVVNFLLEAVRLVTTRMPYGLLRGISCACAMVDWLGFVLPYRFLKQIHLLGPLVERVTPARIKLYSHYPFQVLYADWFDRLAAPIRFYYDEEGVRALVGSGGLSDVRVMPTGLYGWRACGVKRGQTNEVGVEVVGEQHHGSH